MLPLAHIKALHVLYARLANTDIHWAITGSTSFALQGIPIEVHDIDLQTDELGAYRIQDVLKEYVVRPVALQETIRIKSHFGLLDIACVLVEVMGGIQKRRLDGSWEPPVDPVHYRHFVIYEGLQLPVLSLECEIEAYLKLGRLEKAKFLQSWLASRR